MIGNQVLLSLDNREAPADNTLVAGSLLMGELAWLMLALT
jgi:hypothetical protein